MNSNKTKTSLTALILMGLLSINNAATADVPEGRTVRKHQEKVGGLHQKYKEQHRTKISVEKKAVVRRIKDVDLVIEDKSIAKNALLKKYIKKILKSKGDEKLVERYIWLINDIPGYEVDYDFRDLRTSRNVKEVELILKITRTKAKLAVESSNHGTADIGKYQFASTAQMLNPFGWNDSYSVNVGTSDKPKSLLLVTGGYNNKLNSCGTEFNFVGSYMRDDNYREQGRSNTKYNTSTLFRGELVQPLIMTNNNGLDFGIGVDRREVTNYATSTANVTSKTISYNYVTGYAFAKGRHLDFLKGQNLLTVHFYNTLDKANITVFDSTSESAFDSNFGYFAADYYREQPLFLKKLSYLLHAAGHYSNNTLPTENQFFVGGAHSGKGYRSGLISSNKGALLYSELRYDFEFNNKFMSKLQPYAFYEGAYISKPRCTVNKSQFYSGGGGVRVSFFGGIMADFELAIPVTKKVTVDGVVRDNPTKFNFFVFKEFSF